MLSPADVTSSATAVEAPSHPGGRARLWLRPTYEGPGGIRELLAIAGPLILTSSVHALNMFLDRMFLSRYSALDFGASVQGGVTWWALVTIPFGVVAYANTFVAQYTGANQPNKVGPAIWQALYLAFLGAILCLGLLPLAPMIFNAVGHEAPLPQLETTYFQILVAGIPFSLAGAALSAFYTGRGKTWPVVQVNVLILITNTFLNWWFIFHGGPWGIVPKGIAGSAWATVVSSAVGATTYAIMLSRPKYDEMYHTLRGWRFDFDLAKRLVRFGVPAGIHGFADMIAFTSFLLVVGSFGIVSQVATNMAMNLNMLVFIPAVGLYTACQILAGQYVGAGRPSNSERTTVGALVIAIAYFTLIGIIFAAFPQQLLTAFSAQDSTSAEVYAEASKLAEILLLFVAAFSMFDAVCLALSGTLRGAGDTKFVMWASVALSQTLLLLPCLTLGYLARVGSLDPKKGLYLAWVFITNYILCAAAFYALRYRHGSWMRMSVIRDTTPESPTEGPSNAPTLQSA